MSKMADLDAAVAELRRCAKALIGVADALREVFSGEDAVRPEPTAPPLTLEDVRAALARKSLEGRTAEVRALIRKFDADRLSGVDPARYTELLREAEAL